MVDQPDDPKQKLYRYLATEPVTEEISKLFGRGFRAWQEYSRAEDGFIAPPPWYYRELAELITRLVTEHPESGPEVLGKVVLPLIEQTSYARQDRVQDEEVVNRWAEEIRRKKPN